VLVSSDEANVQAQWAMTQLAYDSNSRTVQASYQALDAGFVGLIVSCFNRTQGAEEGNRLSVIAFQSVLDDPESHELEALDADEEEDAQMRQALAASRARVFLSIVPSVQAEEQLVLLANWKFQSWDFNFHSEMQIPDACTFAACCMLHCEVLGDCRWVHQSPSREFVPMYANGKHTRPTIQIYTMGERTHTGFKLCEVQFSACCVVCTDMVELRSTSWAKRIIPLSISPSEILPDVGYFQDFYQLHESLVKEELAPYDEEAAALEASEPFMPGKLLRGMHSSSILCQSLSDLIQVLIELFKAC
jgi:hypothetical protein